MKVKYFWLNKNDEQICKMQFVAETQEESSLLVELGSCIKKPVTYYGRVDKNETWAWLFVPISKAKGYKCFGNL